MSQHQQANSFVEKSILDEFRRKAEHLRLIQASTPMQHELVRIATPFHRKLQEMGYTAAESRLMLKRAFNHKPPPASKWLPRKELTVFNT